MTFRPINLTGSPFSQLIRRYQTTLAMLLLISGSHDAKQNILHKRAVWGWGQREYRGNRGKPQLWGTEVAEILR